MLDRAPLIVDEVAALVAAADLGPELTAEALSLWHAVDDTISTFVGLHLTTVADGYPVTFAWFTPHLHPNAIGASIRIPLSPTTNLTNPLLRPHHRGQASKTVLRLFAGTPGAFVDLAADLTRALHLDPYVTGPTPGTERTDNLPATVSPHASASRDNFIRVDADLTPAITTTTIVGLDDLDTLNRAIGVLIDHGHHPDQAHDELHRQAHLVGVDAVTLARQLLLNV